MAEFYRDGRMPLSREECENIKNKRVPFQDLIVFLSDLRALAVEIALPFHTL